MTTAEYRSYRHVAGAELRKSEDGSTATLAGAAAVFMRYSQNLGGFVEQVAPEAFDDVVAQAERGERNTMGLGNHDPSWLLGSTDSDTLALRVEPATGLLYEITLDLADPDGVRMARKVETRKMRGSSFSFRVAPDGDEWALTEQGFPLRTLLKVSALYDVGPVSFPAYRQTEGDDVAVALRSLAHYVDEDPARVMVAAEKGELRSLLQGAPVVPEPDEQKAEPRSAAVLRWQRSSRTA